MRAQCLTLVAIMLTACGELEQYKAEVGYREGTEDRWHIGEPKSRADCTNEAIGMYNSINAKSPGRAFSWACLLYRDGRIISRHR